MSDGSVITSIEGLVLDAKGFYRGNPYCGYNIKIIKPGVRHNNLLTRFVNTRNRARKCIDKLGKKHKHSLGMAIKISQTGKVLDKFKEIACFDIDYYDFNKAIPTISIYEDDVYEDLFSNVEKKLNSIEKDCTWSELL